MSELVPPEPKENTSAASVPKQRSYEISPIIHLDKENAEMLTSAFITDLQTSLPDNIQGIDLAHHIENILQTNEENRSAVVQGVLELMNETDVFGNDELFDQKYDHDPVFHGLVDTLQNTKNQSRGLRDQRQIALRLTELRAAVPSDATSDDQHWLDIVDRLFR